VSEDVFCGMDGDRETTEHHLAGFTGLTASLGRSFYRVMHLPRRRGWGEKYSLLVVWNMFYFSI